MELFADTMDIWTDGKLDRWMLPLVCMGKSLLDSNGKLIALLWILSLCVEPSYVVLRWVVDHVLAICTDMGA